MSKMHIKLEGSDESHTVEWQPGRGTAEEGDVAALVDGQLISGRILTTGPGTGVLRTDDGRILPFAARAGSADEVTVWIGGRLHRFDVSSGRASRKRAAGGGPGGLEVRAPMPGTVLKMLVSVGDRVEVDQPVAVMESMKMEMTLRAPSSGTVQQTSASVGQMVDMNALLIVLESSTATA